MHLAVLKNSNFQHPTIDRVESDTSNQVAPMRIWEASHERSEFFSVLQDDVLLLFLVAVQIASSSLCLFALPTRSFVDSVERKQRNNKEEKGRDEKLGTKTGKKAMTDFEIGRMPGLLIQEFHTMVMTKFFWKEMVKDIKFNKAHTHTHTQRN